MKFFVKVFLLILNLFLFIEIVLSIKCHKSDNKGERQCWNELFRTERRRPKELSSLFVCLRNAFEKERDPNCEEWVNASCYTLTYELQDQTQFMVKDCDKSDHTSCPHTKEGFDNEFAFGPFITTSSRCDFCSSDNCNNQKPRDKPLLPPTPPPPRMAAGLKCYVTDDSNCEESYESPSKLINCVRNATKQDKSVLCPQAVAACTTTRIKLDDGEQLVIKSCIGPETVDCEEISIIYRRAFIAKAECESCDTNFCNGGAANESTHNGLTPVTPSKEKHSQENHSRETHSGRSHSVATSTVPIAFGIFIFNLFVHFLI